MAFIHHQYGNNWNWDPVLGYPNQKVVFDGATRNIFVNEGVTELDVRTDIYSAWKEWNLAGQEAPNPIVWPKAFSVVGGDPITDTVDLGTTFFLENEWRIQPFPSKSPYTLTIKGNIYTREAGGTINLFAEGVSVSLERSNIVELITVEALGVALTPEDITNIASAAADQVWDEVLAEHQIAGSTGAKLKDNLKKTQYIARI
jgi:hypothetical protein